MWTHGFVDIAQCFECMVSSVCPRPQVLTGNDVIVAISTDPSWLGPACGVDHLLKVAGPHTFLAAAGPFSPGLRPAGPTFQHEGRASFRRDVG